MAAIKKQQKDAILCNQASHANVLSPVGPRSHEGDNKQTLWHLSEAQKFDCMIKKRQGRSWVFGNKLFLCITPSTN